MQNKIITFLSIALITSFFFWWYLRAYYPIVVHSDWCKISSGAAITTTQQTRQKTWFSYTYCVLSTQVDGYDATLSWYAIISWNREYKTLKVSSNWIEESQVVGWCSAANIKVGWCSEVAEEDGYIYMWENLWSKELDDLMTRVYSGRERYVYCGELSEDFKYDKSKKINYRY